MTVEDFFELFMKELRSNEALWEYYKFLGNPKRFSFRKAYLCQRLQYILDHIGDKDQKIWDCGCGYGTTALFLAMNGYRVHGTTLEFYFKEIEDRKQFWSAYGDVSQFETYYEDIFSSDYSKQFDSIIVQDTLHHLEPLTEALQILKNSLKPSGRLLVIEENGSNIVQNIKLFRKRGFNRKLEQYDEVLKKNVVFGDENIRGLKSWKQLLKNTGFEIQPSSIEYIRFYPPNLFSRDNYSRIIKKEKTIASNFPPLAVSFYFGINFIAVNTIN